MIHYFSFTIEVASLGSLYFFQVFLHSSSDFISFISLNNPQPDVAIIALEQLTHSLYTSDSEDQRSVEDQLNWRS